MSNENINEFYTACAIILYMPSVQYVFYFCPITLFLVLPIRKDYLLRNCSRVEWAVRIYLICGTTDSALGPWRVVSEQCLHRRVSPLYRVIFSKAVKKKE